MNLEIDKNNVTESFNRIAKELLLEHCLLVNEVKVEITEIEFYYFYEGKHEDNYTHRHLRKSGEWRMHNSGLDLTFKGNEVSDGGILIRGIKVNNECIKGPRKVLFKIFELYGSAFNKNSLSLSKITPINAAIETKARHLPNKVRYPEFHDKKYRYFVD